MRDASGPRGPDFLVIGAQRAGTTWLHRVLRRHPGLWLPPVKELHYFDKLSTGKSGIQKRWRQAMMSGRYILDPWHLKYLIGEENDEWYGRLFHNAQQKGRLTGEITPAYATLDEDMFRRIRAINGNIKLVFVMRDPIDRAWSAVLNAFKKDPTVGAVTVDKALARARTPGATARAAYTNTLRCLEAVFPDDQLYFCFFEDLCDQPERFAANLLSFLGVEPGDVRRLVRQRVLNAAGASKPVPLDFAREIAKSYAPMIRELCQRFEGPPHCWYARCEQLLAQ
jgi:Sulfotransferase family